MSKEACDFLAFSGHDNANKNNDGNSSSAHTVAQKQDRSQLAALCRRSWACALSATEWTVFASLALSLVLEAWATPTLFSSFVVD